MSIEIGPNLMQAIQAVATALAVIVVAWAFLR